MSVRNMISADRLRIRRPLVWCAAGAGLGVLMGLRLPLEAAGWLLGAAGTLGILLVFARPRGPALPLAAAAALLLAFCARTCAVMHTALPAAGSYTVEGVVLQTPRVRENGRHVAVHLRDVTLTAGDGSRSAAEGLYWTAYVDEGYALPVPGTTVRAEGRLYLPSGQRNPEGFDFGLYLKQNHMTAGLYNSGEYETVPDPPFSLRTWLIRLKYALVGRLDAAFGEFAALPKALLLGEREALSEEDRQAFTRVGIAHVLAVSGLHISLLVSAIRLLVGRFLSGRKQLWLFGVFLALYALLLDLRASVVRASILTFAYLYTRARGRKGDSLSALALAFMVILLISPVDLLSAGFQLSFAAALGIILLNRPVRRLTDRLVGRRAGGLLASTVSAVAGTALPSIQTYHCFSVASLLFSPIVCALLAYILPLCLAVLALSFLWMDAARALAFPVGWILKRLLDGVSLAAGWPGMSVNCPRIPYAFYPLVGALLWLCSGYAPERFRGRRRWMLLSVLLAAGTVVHLCTLDRGVRYIQMDVGSADCAVIQDGRHTTVIDCGEDGRDLSDYLLAAGRHADVLVLTHLHADHCFGAQALMDNGIGIDLLVLPQGAESMAVSEEALALLDALRAYCREVRFVSAGDGWHTGRTSAEVLWPEDGKTRAGRDANDYCLCLRYTMENTVFLLTGDLTGLYEDRARCDADILKVAHHGGKTSTSESFLAEVTPQAAIISVADTREAADPEGEMQRRLRQAGAGVYTTAAGGAVFVDVSPSGYTVTQFLGEDTE